MRKKETVRGNKRKKERKDWFWFTVQPVWIQVRMLVFKVHRQKFLHLTSDAIISKNLVNYYLPTLSLSPFICVRPRARPCVFVILCLIYTFPLHLLLYFYISTNNFNNEAISGYLLSYIYIYIYIWMRVYVTVDCHVCACVCACVIVYIYIYI